MHITLVKQSIRVVKVSSCYIDSSFYVWDHEQMVRLGT